MNTTKSEKVLEEAAYWSARLRAPDLSEQERADLQRWLGADPAHAEAFAAARIVAKGVTQLTRIDPRLKALADEAYAMGAGDGSPSRRSMAPRWLAPAAFAAGIGLLAVLGVRLASHTEPLAPPAKVYAAGDSLRQVVLDDGSRLSLDAGASVRVAYAPRERRLELLGGRALFEVAHDRQRPFSVTAHGVTTTALGTRFQVDRAQDDAVTVLLSEGSVRVDQGIRGGERSERLVPGEQLSVSANTDTPWVKRAVDAEVATSWSRGRLVFRATPLAQAVAEINRHAGTKLVLGDPALADLAVSGNFIPGDSRLIVSAFVSVLPLRAVESDGEIVLFLRHDDEVDG